MINVLPSIDTSGGQDGVIRLASDQINTITTTFGNYATIIQKKIKIHILTIKHP